MNLGQRIVSAFNRGDWEELGLLTGHSETIDNYPRLLRSLDWGDSDYSGNVLGVLRQVAESDPKAFREIENYVNRKYPDQSEEYVSAKPAERRITFSPNVFEVPDSSIEPDLVAVMMPFREEFAAAYKAITRACKAVDLR